MGVIYAIGRGYTSQNNKIYTGFHHRYYRFTSEIEVYGVSLETPEGIRRVSSSTTLVLCFNNTDLIY